MSYDDLADFYADCPEHDASPAAHDPTPPRDNDVQRTSDEIRARYLAANLHDRVPYKLRALHAANASGMSDREFRVMFTVLSYARADGGNAFPSHDTIAAIIDRDPKASKRAIRELEKLGWIKSVRRRRATAVRRVVIPANCLLVEQSARCAEETDAPLQEPFEILEGSDLSGYEPVEGTDLSARKDKFAPLTFVDDPWEQLGEPTFTPLLENSTVESRRKYIDASVDVYAATSGCDGEKGGELMGCALEQTSSSRQKKTEMSAVACQMPHIDKKERKQKPQPKGAKPKTSPKPGKVGLYGLDDAVNREIEAMLDHEGVDSNFDVLASVSDARLTGMLKGRVGRALRTGEGLDDLRYLIAAHAYYRSGVLEDEAAVAGALTSFRDEYLMRFLGIEKEGSWLNSWTLISTRMAGAVRGGSGSYDYVE